MSRRTKSLGQRGAEEVLLGGSGWGRLCTCLVTFRGGLRVSPWKCGRDHGLSGLVTYEPRSRVEQDGDLGPRMSGREGCRYHETGPEVDMTPWW